MAKEEIKTESDRESGEIVSERVVVLRKRPNKRKIISELQNACTCLPVTYKLKRECQLSHIYKIQEMLQKVQYLNGCGCMNEAEMAYYTDFTGFLREYRNTRKPRFRVPSEYLYPKDTGKLEKLNVISITRWEEFLYGVDALDYSSSPNGEKECSPPLIPYTLLKQYLPDIALNTIIYILFFLGYFWSMSCYNNYLQLFCYILLAGHLKIHLRAYEKNVEVNFTGSVFQGPAFTCVSTWCEHCQQKEKEKVVNKLMKKMKIDILNNNKKYQHKTPKKDILSNKKYQLKTPEKDMLSNKKYQLKTPEKDMLSNKKYQHKTSENDNNKVSVNR